MLPSRPIRASVCGSIVIQVIVAHFLRSFCEITAEVAILRRGIGSPLHPHRHALRQHPPDAADGLSCALFVFDQTEPYMAVAVVAEAYARDLRGRSGFCQQELRELKRAEVLIGFGDFGPDEHRCLGDGTTHPAR